VIGATTDKEIRNIFYGTPLISAIEILVVFVEFCMQGKVQFSIAVRADFWSRIGGATRLPSRRHAHGMYGKIVKTFYFSWPQQNRKLACRQLSAIGFLFSCSLRL
jgi:hypothetical protein